MRHLEHAQDAWHANRPSASDRIHKGKWPAGLIEEQTRRGTRWRGLPPVIGLDAPGGVLEVEQESAAADAGGLRFDQIKHHLRGNGGIDRVAAHTQHVAPSRGRERIGGNHHRMPADGFGHAIRSRGLRPC